MRDAKSYINKKLTPPKSFFDWCYSEIPTFEWSNKEKTIRASERRGCTVIKKKLTKRTRLDFFDKFYSFAIVLVTAKRIEIQSYGFWSSINAGYQTIEMELINFEQFANNEHVKVTRSGDRYYFGLNRISYMSGPYTSVKFYENDWRTKIEELSELKYLEFEWVEHYDLEQIYKYRSEIEFLQKIKAKKLAFDVMYPHYFESGFGFKSKVDMRVINANWLKKNKPFFKNSDRSFNEFELERRIKARNGKVVPGIEKYLDYRCIKKIPKKAKLIHFQNWVIKNEINFKYYCDYLNLMSDLHVQLDDEDLITPKDLTKAHDNAVELLNQTKRELEAKEFEKRLKARKNYEVIIGDYAFVLPEKATDLIAEGKKMHHCVGGSNYINDYGKGKTTIIFIRKKDAINKPFYTMEYRSKRVIQLRGKYNAEPTEEIEQVVDEWTKRMQKIAN